MENTDEKKFLELPLNDVIDLLPNFTELNKIFKEVRDQISFKKNDTSINLFREGFNDAFTIDENPDVVSIIESFKSDVFSVINNADPELTLSRSNISDQVFTFFRQVKLNDDIINLSKNISRTSFLKTIKRILNEPVLNIELLYNFLDKSIFLYKNVSEKFNDKFFYDEKFGLKYFLNQILNKYELKFNDEFNPEKLFYYLITLNINAPDLFDLTVFSMNNRLDSSDDFDIALVLKVFRYMIRSYKKNKFSFRSKIIDTPFVEKIYDLYLSNNLESVTDDYKYLELYFSYSNLKIELFVDSNIIVCKAVSIASSSPYNFLSLFSKEEFDIKSNILLKFARNNLLSIEFWKEILNIYFLEAINLGALVNVFYLFSELKSSKIVFNFDKLLFDLIKSSTEIEFSNYTILGVLNSYYFNKPLSYESYGIVYYLLNKIDILSISSVSSKKALKLFFERAPADLRLDYKNLYNLVG